MTRFSPVAIVVFVASSLVPAATPASAKRPRRGTAKTPKKKGLRRRSADGPGDRRKRLDTPDKAGKTNPDKERKLKEKLVKRVLLTERGCHLKGHKRLLKTLLAWHNKSQLMNLEVWGDTKRYRRGQKVFFFFRSPRDAYVTLFWIGPNGDVVIPMSNTRIPGNRNVRIWTGGEIVPPLGRERWVAVSTLETIPLTCLAGDKGWLKTIGKFKAIPHAVGRWEVYSR